MNIPPPNPDPFRFAHDCSRGSACSTNGLPVLVLAGALGAGKTSLLNRILAQSASMRYAVIENEFGEISIDTQLIDRTRSPDVYELTNGCICCTIRDELMSALQGVIVRQDEFDYVLIECTGVADPAPILQDLAFTAAREYLDLKGVVTIVDATNAMRQLEEQPVVQKQIACADLLVLNKTDLGTPELIADLQRTLSGINADAAQLIGDVRSMDSTPVIKLEALSLDKVTLSTKMEDHPATLDVTSVGFVVSGDLDEKRLRAWLIETLEQQADEIYRSKGILALAGEPRRVVFQGVHSMMNWAVLEPWEESDRQSSLLFIGRNLDREALRAGLFSCRC